MDTEIEFSLNSKGSDMKQVIVVRKDLRMELGKVISQACHACLEASEKVKKKDLKGWRIWRREGAKKIVLRVDSLDELVELNERAEQLNITKSLVVDRGLTQVPPNTPTTLGIGPAEEALLDKLTGDLRLL